MSVQTANRVRVGDSVRSWGEFAAYGTGRFGSGESFRTRRTVFVVSNAAEAIAAVVYGLAQNLDYGIIERRRLSPELIARFRENSISLFDAHEAKPMYPPPGAAADVQPGRVTVLSSGTTGLLKLIAHSWATLNTFTHVKSQPEYCWFFPYQIGAYAWYQMLAMSLFVSGQHLYCGDPDDLAGSFEAALRAGGVTAISSTPSFWRHVLMAIEPEVFARASLANITLGGEIVDQAILDRLAALYPSARLRHIYASSEAGAAIVVTDRQAGFPAALIGKDGATVALKVEDGRLFVRSPYNNRAMTDAWIDTGDLVERRNDRYYFCGRAGDAMINVGGQKAFAADIESRLLSHPGVVWARVSARKAPFVGYLPAAKVVLKDNLPTAEAEYVLAQHCAAALPEYAVPRIWEFLDAIPIRASLKS
jgi:acyl-coenzyme A synthetase/AMP-(fatty) acid ligase